MEETQIVAEAGRYGIFDEQSVLFTPPPIAYSTDLKSGRYQYGTYDDEGSFITSQESVVIPVTCSKTAADIREICCGGSTQKVTVEKNDNQLTEQELTLKTLNLSVESCLSEKTPSLTEPMLKQNAEKSRTNVAQNSTEKCYDKKYKNKIIGSASKENCGVVISKNENKNENCIPVNAILLESKRASGERTNKHKKLLQPTNNNVALCNSKTDNEHTVLITDETEPFCSITSDTLFLEFSKCNTNTNADITNPNIGHISTAVTKSTCNSINTITSIPKINQIASDIHSNTEDIGTELAFWMPFDYVDKIVETQSTFENNEEFFSADHALAQLAQDELEFEKENCIFKDDQMVPLKDDATENTFACVDDENLDISIGEHIRAYSSFLGSSSFDRSKKRPTFGNDHLSSPPMRTPQPLLEMTSHAHLNNSTIQIQNENVDTPVHNVSNILLNNSGLQTTSCEVNDINDTIKSTVNEVSAQLDTKNQQSQCKNADESFHVNDTQLKLAVLLNQTNKNSTEEKESYRDIVSEQIQLDVSCLSDKKTERCNENSFHISFVSQEKTIQKSSVADQSFEQSMIFSDMKVIAPSELNLMDICCMGCTSNFILSLLNETCQWLDVIVEIVSVSVNDKELNLLDSYNPFLFQPKVILEPQTTGSCKISFQPHTEGSYLTILRITGIPFMKEKSALPRLLQSVIILRAQAEFPMIRIQSERMHHDNVLDFGELQQGGNARATITIENLGLANVPLQLSLNNNRGAGSFKFYVSNNDSSELGAKFYCALAGRNDIHGNCKVTLILDCISNMATLISSNLMHEICGNLDVKIDSNHQHILLQRISMIATVGSVHIHIPKELHDIIQLDCLFGNVATFRLPIRNAGTITATVYLKVTEKNDQFYVQPQQIIVKPNTTQLVDICFSSAHSSAEHTESFLLLNVQPSGVVYEVKLRANVAVPAITKQPLSNVLLLADKQSVCWGGVALGGTQHQMIRFQNGTDFAFDVCFSLMGSPDFHLLGLEHVQTQNGKQSSVTIAAKDIYRLYVLFAPTAIAEATAVLRISVLNSSVSFTIPLLGFGGNSQVVIQNISIGHSNSYWLNVGSLVTNATIVTKVVLKNTGHRTAFVKATCYKDMMCTTTLDENQLRIQPNAFCLAPNKEQTLLLVLKPNQFDVVQCESQSSIIAVIAFFYGNEILRKRLRKFCHEKYVIGKLCDNLLQLSANFDLEFANERAVEHSGSTLLGTEDRVFRSSLTRVCLAVVGEPLQQHSNIVSTKIQQLKPSAHNSELMLHQAENSMPVSLSSLCRKDIVSGKSSTSDIPEHDGPTTLKFHSYISSVKSLKENLPLIQVLPQNIDFGNKKVGEKCRMNLIVRNKDVIDHQLMISGVHIPFRVKFSNLTLKSRNYVTLPIDFRPQKSGSFSNILVIDNNKDVQIKVMLSGNVN